MTYTSDDEVPEEIRDPEQIAKRALALFAVVRLAMGAPRDQTLAWLREHALWDALSPAELDFISTATPTRQQVINASWRAEALLVLIWALRLVETMPALNEPYDTNDLKGLLPPYTSQNVGEFVATAVRLPDDALLEYADDVLNSHWEARDASIRGKPVPENLHIGIIQERHHAINWVTGYGNLPWDEVTTDT